MRIDQSHDQQLVRVLHSIRQWARFNRLIELRHDHHLPADLAAEMDLEIATLWVELHAEQDRTAA